MPYDVAASQVLPSELRARRTQTRGMDIQNRILDMSRKYYEETGTSEAFNIDREMDQRDRQLGQGDRQLSIDEFNSGIREQEAETSARSLRQRIEEFGLDMKKEARESMEQLVEVSGIAERYMQETGDVKGGQEIFEAFMDTTGAREQFKGTALESFNPEVIKSFATASQVKDPLAPLNYVIPGGKAGSVARDDLPRIKSLIGQGAMFDPTGAMLTGGIEGIEDRLQNDDPLFRAYATKEQQYQGVFELMGDMDELVASAPDIEAGTGTVGGLVRMADSVTSQIQGVIGLMDSVNKPQEIVGGKPGDANPVTNPQAYQSEWAKFTERMQAGPFKQAVMSSTQLQTMIKMLVYASARIQGTNNDRLSDNDVKHWMDIYNVGSVDQLKAAMSVMKKQLENERNISRRMMDPTGEFAKKMTGNENIETDEATGKRYRFKGGDRTKQENWEEI